MNSKTFSNFFVKSFLFGLVLLCLVGISSTDVKAQAPARITIKKDVCDSIGQNNNCNGNNTALKDRRLEFTVQSGASATGTFRDSVFVTINLGGGSNGQTTTGDTFFEGETIRVCEAPVSGFDSLPQPEPGTGSTGGGSQTADGDCIIAVLGPGNNVLQFINVAIAPTAATAKVSGRIRDINGKPATRVSVTITNITTGEMFATRTDLFGRYAFTELATGEDYLLRVFSKRNVFKVNEMFINLLEDLANANFTADSGRVNSAARQ